MNDTKIISLINEADSEVKDKFRDEAKSSCEVENDYRRVEFDYTWLEKIEETIEDLDTIVRNPRKFIVQEEEIVPIELSKRVSLESIRHLAQHTNLIQEYDEKTDTLTPSKILNVNKEESYDIYENRFIYSLLINLGMFLARRVDLSKEGSSVKNNKVINYHGSTHVGNEEVEIKLEMTSKLFEDLVGRDPNGLDLTERIERVQLIISDFMKSAFIKELAAGHVMMVKSPIRKTNVILKNTNFQKALELWEFIERYNVNDKTEVVDNKKYEDKGDLKNLMDNAFYIDYLVMNTITDEVNLNVKKNKAYYRNLIRKFVAGMNQDNKNISKMLAVELKKINEEDSVNLNKTKIIYKKAINDYYRALDKQKNILEACKYEA